MLKDPGVPLPVRIQACEKLIRAEKGRLLPAHVSRYCRYELERGVARIREQGEDLDLLERLAFLCSEECWSYELCLTLLPTRAVLLALSVLSRKVFQNPF
jgi:hypothetical protein